MLYPSGSSMSSKLSTTFRVALRAASRQRGMDSTARQLRISLHSTHAQSENNALECTRLLLAENMAIQTRKGQEAAHLGPSTRLSGGGVLAWWATAECETGVMEGCPARSGARLAEAAIAATHSKRAGALTDEACRANMRATFVPQVPSYHRDCRLTAQIAHRHMVGQFLPVS